MLHCLRHNGVRRPHGIENTEAFRPAGGTQKEALAYALMEGQSLGFETPFALLEPLAIIPGLSAPEADFRREDSVRRILLDVTEEGGRGVFDRLMTDPARLADDRYLPYVKGDII